MKTIQFLKTLSLAGLFTLAACAEQTESIAKIEAVPEKTKSEMPVLVQADGSYPTIPLEKDVIVVKVIQTTVDNLSEFPTVEEGLDHNLKHMEAMAEKACSTGKKPDFLLYHEFPLTGYSSGTRTEKLPFTVKIPGPETERLGKIARKCDTYLVFGTYATDDDWPGHILSLNAVINRKGEIAKAFWKSRNIKRLYPDREITTTTIEAVRDKYRAMYGPEEEFPVLQTEYGNIAVSTVQFDPFIFAAFAMRGTEIMIRTATLFAEYDVRATAYVNNFYSTMTNIAFDYPGYKAGESVIIGPKAKILAKSKSLTEDDIIEAEIPIAAFRKGRKIPNYAYEMTRPILDQYVQEFPLNHLDMPQDELPETGKAMKDLMESMSRFNSEHQTDAK